MTYIERLKKAGFNKNNKAAPVHNFNRNSKNKRPKIIIVGTLTPQDGRNHGFFYSSDKNHMFEYINNALGTNLQQPNNQTDIDNIIAQLDKVGITFLDVVESSAA